MGGTGEGRLLTTVAALSEILLNMRIVHDVEPDTSVARVSIAFPARPCGSYDRCIL